MSKSPSKSKNISKKRKKSSSKKTRPVAPKRRKKEVEEIDSPGIWDMYIEHKERIHSLLYLFGIFVSIYMGLSMMSYNPSPDSSNIGGVLGQYFAQMLFHSLGYGAWSILFLGGVCAWKLAKRSIGGVSKMIGFAGLLWSFTSALSLLFPEAFKES